MQIPRTSWSVTPTNYELHVFCDALKGAYVCVAYLVCHFHDSKDGAAVLILSKTRLSPLKVGAENSTFKNDKEKSDKSRTIPYLQLLAVIYTYLRKELMIKLYASYL